MVKIYGMYVENLPDPKECPEVMEGIWQKRQEKILKYKQTLSRKQSLGAGLLLNHVLKLHGCSVRQLTFGEHGKPEVEGICFNLSHSHGYTICAVSSQPVGCDIEKVEKIRERVAERYFTEKEFEGVKSLEGRAKDEAFYRLWTMKESFFKMLGNGIQMGMKRCEFLLDEPIQVCFDGERFDCHIREYELDGYKISVCAEASKFADEIEYISYE